MKLTSNHSYDRFIRYGLIAIGLAGFLFAAGDALIPQEGAMFRASEDPEAFARLVTTVNFQLWALRGLIGIPLEVIGFIALFFGLLGTRKEKLAFWGMLLCVVLNLFGIGVFTLSYFVFPEAGHLIIAGHEAAAATASFERFMPIAGGYFIGRAVGLVMFAIAIWSSGIFPKWSGILAVIGWLLLPFEAYVVQIGANALWGSAYLWMAAHSWERFTAPLQLARQTT